LGIIFSNAQLPLDIAFNATVPAHNKLFCFFFHRDLTAL